jgi:hypothetical protein
MARDWMATYLNAAGFPDTAKNRRLLSVWQRYEGGHTKNSARFNYLNTTQNMPGSRSINSVGVKAYRNLQQGALAWAKTLKNGRYGDLMQGFASGDPYKANVVKGLSTWLSGSPDSAAGHTYAQKVLGGTQAGPEPAPGAPAPQQPQVDLGLPTPKRAPRRSGRSRRVRSRPTSSPSSRRPTSAATARPRGADRASVDAQIQGHATDKRHRCDQAGAATSGLPTPGAEERRRAVKGIAQGANITSASTARG